MKVQITVHPGEALGPGDRVGWADVAVAMLGVLSPEDFAAQYLWPAFVAAWQAAGQSVPRSLPRA